MSAPRGWPAPLARRPRGTCVLETCGRRRARGAPHPHAWSPLALASRRVPAPQPRACSLGLRTRADVLRVLARELVDAPSLAAVHAAVAPVRRRLLAAGVYTDVQLTGEPAAGGGDAMDVVVGVRPKRTLGLAVGGTQSVSGKLEAGTEVSLFDVLGLAETVKVSVTSSPGSLSGSDILQTLSATAEPALGAGGAAAGSEAWAHAKRELMNVTPSYRLQLSKPTLGACARRGRRLGGARGTLPTHHIPRTPPPPPLAYCCSGHAHPHQYHTAQGAGQPRLHQRFHQRCACGGVWCVRVRLRACALCWCRRPLPVRL